MKNVSGQLNIIENKPDENEWTVIASEDVLLSNLTAENYVAIYVNMLKKENIEYVSYFEEKIEGSHKYPRYKATVFLYVKNSEFDKVMELAKEKGIYVLDDEPEELREEIGENEKELELLPLNKIIEKIIMTMVLLMLMAVDIFCVIFLISDFGVDSIFLNLFMFGFTWLTIRIIKKGKFN